MTEKARLRDENDRLRHALDSTRDRLDIARTDARVWKQNYEGTVRFLAVFAPPDAVELIEDHAFRCFAEEKPWT
ncbi:MAG: hypothetical protein H0U59_03400 [Gemmatimonadaceae bacterium]|nr:hypothetical protein [Gemmatimonadaceae bacterium]